MNEEVKEDKENITSESATEDKEITLKESEFKKLTDDAASFKDKYVRILAEFDNARKRNER